MAGPPMLRTLQSAWHFPNGLLTRSGGEIGRRARLRILKNGLSRRFKSFQQKPQNPHQIRLREFFLDFIKAQSSEAETPSLLHKLLHNFFSPELAPSIAQQKSKNAVMSVMAELAL
jgi:hypothetical protein